MHQISSMFVKDYMSFVCCSIRMYTNVVVKAVHCNIIRIYTPVVVKALHWADPSQIQRGAALLGNAGGNIYCMSHACHTKQVSRCRNILTSQVPH